MARVTKTIRVTSKRICEGLFGNEKACPIALAMEGVGLKEPFVCGTMRFKYRGKVYYVDTPPRAIGFIDVYDRGWDHPWIKPFKFNITFDT